MNYAYLTEVYPMWVDSTSFTHFVPIRDNLLQYDPYNPYDPYATYDCGVKLHCTVAYGDIDSEKPECGICLENTQELLVFVPCGHYCSCSECSAKITKCPMCRTVINNKISKAELKINQKNFI